MNTHAEREKAASYGRALGLEPKAAPKAALLPVEFATLCTPPSSRDIVASAVAELTRPVYASPEWVTTHDLTSPPVVPETPLTQASTPSRRTRRRATSARRSRASSSSSRFTSRSSL